MYLLYKQLVWFEFSTTYGFLLTSGDHFWSVQPGASMFPIGAKALRPAESWWVSWLFYGWTNTCVVLIGQSCLLSGDVSSFHGINKNNFWQDLIRSWCTFCRSMNARFVNVVMVNAYTTQQMLRQQMTWKIGVRIDLRMWFTCVWQPTRK